MSNEPNYPTPAAPATPSGEVSPIIDIWLASVLGIALGCAISALLGLPTQYAGIVVAAATFVSIAAGTYAYYQQPDHERAQSGRAAFVGLRFLVDWSIRLLLLAFLALWAQGTYNAHVEAEKAKQPQKQSSPKDAPPMAR